jgi:hypothetical protein
MYRAAIATLHKASSPLVRLGKSRLETLYPAVRASVSTSATSPASGPERFKSPPNDSGCSGFSSKLTWAWITGPRKLDLLMALVALLKFQSEVQHRWRV